MNKKFQGPVKIKYSKTLSVNYVEIVKKERGIEHKVYLTESGVLLTDKDVKISVEELKKLYKEKIFRGENVYDFNFAQTTGAVRMLRNRKNPITEKPLFLEETPEVITISNTPTSTETVVQGLPLQEEYIKENEVVQREYKQKEKIRVDSKILSTISLTISFGAVVLSMLYTKDFLLGFNNVFTSYVLSTIMVLFSAIALTIALLFKREGNFGIALVFCFLWVIVTLFSMTSTVAVNYNRFEFTEREALEDNREVNAIRLELESIEMQKQSKLSQIEAKDKEIERFEALDMFSRGVFPSQEERNALQKEYDALLEEERVLRSKEPEAVLVEDVKKRNFFTLLEDITGIDAGTVQFLLSTLPAIFIDIIAPFGIATSVSLLTKRRKEK